MSTQRESRTPRGPAVAPGRPLRPPLPELDVEHELEFDIDFRRLWAPIAARWWLPVAGLLLGALIGFLVALGQKETYQAEAIVYLGPPLAPSAGPEIRTAALTLSRVSEIVGSELALRLAAARAGLRPEDIEDRISVHSVTGNGRVIRGGALSTLALITVKGEDGPKIQRAAGELARIVAGEATPYVEDKIRSLEAKIAFDNRELALVNRRIRQADRQLNALLGNREVPATERLLFQSGLYSNLTYNEQRRVNLEQDKLAVAQTLSLAKNVERARIVQPASYARATARSVRTSLLAGAFIGLLVGVLVASYFEPLASRLHRRPAV